MPVTISARAPGYQTWDALPLPLGVHQEAALAQHQAERGRMVDKFRLGQGERCRATDAVGTDGRPDHRAQLGRDQDRLFQPGRQTRAQRLGREGREEAGEDPDEEAQADLLQAARVEQGDRGEAFGPAVRLVQGEPASVGGADEVNMLEPESVERLVQPLRGPFGLVARLSLHAARCVRDRPGCRRRRRGARR